MDTIEDGTGDSGQESAETSTGSDAQLNTLDDLWGAMKGVMVIAPGVDIMEPTGEVWKAEENFPNPCTGI